MVQSGDAIWAKMQVAGFTQECMPSGATWGLGRWKKAQRDSASTAGGLDTACLNHCNSLGPLSRKLLSSAHLRDMGDLPVFYSHLETMRLRHFLTNVTCTCKRATMQPSEFVESVQLALRFQIALYCTQNCLLRMVDPRAWFDHVWVGKTHGSACQNSSDKFESNTITAQKAQAKSLPVHQSRHHIRKNGRSTGTWSAPRKD